MEFKFFINIPGIETRFADYGVTQLIAKLLISDNEIRTGFITKNPLQVIGSVVTVKIKQKQSNRNFRRLSFPTISPIKTEKPFSAFKITKKFTHALDKPFFNLC